MPTSQDIDTDPGPVERFEGALVQDRRILFIVPLGVGTTPVGGVKVLFEHALVLRAAGVDARLVALNAGDAAQFKDSPVPLEDGKTDIRPGDICIWPEVYEGTTAATLKEQVPASTHVLFIQNHFNLMQYFGSTRDFSEFGFSRIAGCSRAIIDFVRKHYGLDAVSHIPLGLATRPEREKSDLISCMPRKRPFEAEFARKFFERTCPAGRTFEWRDIDGVSFEEARRILDESRIFLSLQRFEGFGLPAIEAMNAGCLVVGFTGFGGDEYATSENGLWVAEDDIEKLPHALAEVVRMLKEDPVRAESLIAEARATAARYSIEARNLAVQEFYGSLLKESRPVVAQ